MSERGEITPGFVAAVDCDGGRQRLLSTIGVLELEQRLV